MIKHWFGVSRFVFNKTVTYLQEPETKANWKAIKTGIINNLPEWAKEVPYQIKSIAIKDACTAVQNAKKKYKQTGEIQRVKFRSRKDKQQSCYIPKSAGVRSFLTLFSPSSFGWVGNRDIGRIQRLCHHLDDVISRSTKVNAKTRKRYRKACDRLRTRIRNLIDELHHKIARFLVDNYDVILLPTFEVSEMVLKNSRKIRTKSVRQMLNWSHYRFNQFLKHKAFETGKLVIDCCEAYTSKTVSWTGELIHNLGGRKVIKSKIDGQKLDRDLNGARGIFLRALVDTPSLKDSLSVHC